MAGVGVRGGAAGRRLGQEDAVSAIIATALLIGVAILLTITILVLIQRVMVDPSDVGAPVTFEVADDLDRLRAIGAAEGAEWRKIGLLLDALDAGGPGICMGDATDGSPAQLVGEDPVAPCSDGTNRLSLAFRDPTHVSGSTSRPVTGDFVAMCGEATTYGARIMVIDTVSQTLLGTFEFVDIRACA